MLMTTGGGVVPLSHERRGFVPLAKAKCPDLRTSHPHKLSVLLPDVPRLPEQEPGEDGVMNNHPNQALLLAFQVGALLRTDCI